jgi:hypothetical protein
MGCYGDSLFLVDFEEYAQKTRFWLKFCRKGQKNKI